MHRLRDRHESALVDAFEQADAEVVEGHIVQVRAGIGETHLHPG
nr:hypothetical protein [Nocardia inohanensis]